MQNKIKSILVIGDSKKSNESDNGFNIYEKYDIKVVFLTPSKKSSFQGLCYHLTPFNIRKKINDIINKHKIDLIYLRGDWFDLTIKIYAEKIISMKTSIPIVFGYHCHTAMITDLEKNIINNADGLVLLNKWAENYFMIECNIYNKNIFLVPSLFLPNLDFYKRSLQKRKSSSDGFLHCVIPTGVIRNSSLPDRKNKSINIENFIFERYDYYSVIKNLAERNIKVHIYGKFHGHTKAKTKMTKYIYGMLKEQYSEHVFYHGFYNGNDFAREISKYDFTIMTGIVPGQIPPPFEHMNYQVRLNTILAAKLPIFIAENTYHYMEDLIESKKIGAVYHSFDSLIEIVNDKKLLDGFTKNIENVFFEHSNDYWVPLLASYFRTVKKQNNKANIYVEKSLLIKWMSHNLLKIKSRISSLLN
jgi:hypothetical protein